MTREHALSVKPGNGDISLSTHKISLLKKREGKNKNKEDLKKRKRMMKKQVTIVAALMILMALSSNLDMVAEAQLGPGDCYDGCSTACVQRDREYSLVN